MYIPESQRLMKVAQIKECYDSEGIKRAYLQKKLDMSPDKDYEDLMYILEEFKDYVVTGKGFTMYEDEFKALDYYRVRQIMSQYKKLFEWLGYYIKTSGEYRISLNPILS